MPGKPVTARTHVWLDATMNLAVSLEVVLAYKTFVAMITAKLSVAKVGLDVRLDVFFAPKFLPATVVHAHPFLVNQVRTADEGCNLIRGDASVFDRCIDLEIELWY